MSWTDSKFKYGEIYRPVAGNYFRTTGAPSILKTDIMTHGSNTDFQKCKCSRCGVEGMSTARTPFRPKGDRNGPLLCNQCFSKGNDK